MEYNKKSHSVTTVMEKVKEYIDSQRSEEHRCKYVKSGKYASNSSPTDWSMVITKS